MIRHFFTKQFLGFLAVGGSAAFVQWSSRILFSFWLPFSVAIILAYALGMALAFTLNSFFVFPKSTKPRRSQARGFVVINLAFFPLVWAASLVFNRALHAFGMLRYSEGLAHGMALALPMAATFLFYKFSAFKDT